MYSNNSTIIITMFRTRYGTLKPSKQERWRVKILLDSCYEYMHDQEVVLRHRWMLVASVAQRQLQISEIPPVPL